MKNWLYLSFLLAGSVVLNELPWIGRTDLAWVLIALGIAVSIQAIALLKK